MLQFYARIHKVSSFNELKISIPIGILAFIVCIFCFTNTFNINIDDLPLQFGQTTPDMFSVHAPNRRFVIATIGALLDAQKISYYQMIGLWSALFAASAIFLAIQIARYLELGPIGTAWIAIAATSHGFFAELYSFTMGYLNYAGGMFGAALVLFGLRRLSSSNYHHFIIGSIGVLFCLGSYQPFVVLPYCIFLVRHLLSWDKTNVSYVPSKEVMWYFGISAAVGLITDLTFAANFTPSPDRSLTINNIVIGQTYLLNTFFDIHFPPASHSYGIIFPFHERTIYFIFTVAMFTLAGFIIFNNSINMLNRIIGLVLLWFLFLLMMGIFNIFQQLYWPTARSLSHLSFIHPAISAYLVSLMIRSPRQYSKHIDNLLTSNTIVWLSIAFLGASMANQLSAYYTRSRQTQSDVALTARIIAELHDYSRRENRPISDTPVAVIGSWRNDAQQPMVFFDYGVSALGVRWSSVPLLRAVSGIRFKEFTPSPKDCPEVTTAFEIHSTKEGWLICLK